MPTYKITKGKMIIGEKRFLPGDIVSISDFVAKGYGLDRLELQPEPIKESEPEPVHQFVTQPQRQGRRKRGTGN